MSIDEFYSIVDLATLSIVLLLLPMTYFYAQSVQTSEDTDLFKNEDDEAEGLLDEMDFDDPLTMKDMDESDEEKA